jgi:hypothetical protein
MLGGVACLATRWAFLGRHFYVRATRLPHIIRSSERRTQLLSSRAKRKPACHRLDLTEQDVRGAEAVLWPGLGPNGQPV